MFHNVNGARLAAKRIQDRVGVKASVAKELVARAAGWPDWHRLEKEVGGPNAPMRGGHASLATYAASKGLTLDVDAIRVLASPVDTPAVSANARLVLTEGAMRMLTALHCGCDAHIWDSDDEDRYCDIVTHLVAPYTSEHSYWLNFREPDARLVTEERTEVRRVEAWMEDNELQAYGDDSPPKALGRYDHAKAVRLDNWNGEDRREDYRDGLMLVRAGLAVYGMADLHITDAGRAVAQAAVGDGRVIEEGEVRVVSVTPDHGYAVGDPKGFAMMGQATCEQRVTLQPGQKGVRIQGRSEAGICIVEVRPEVVKTLAAFLADVGKVDAAMTAKFGNVQVTLEADATATLVFGDRDNLVRARMPKPLARIARTYLAELARGGRQEATLSPVDVSWKGTFAAHPESMAA